MKITMNKLSVSWKLASTAIVALSATMAMNASAQSYQAEAAKRIHPKYDFGGPMNSDSKNDSTKHEQDDVDLNNLTEEESKAAEEAAKAEVRRIRLNGYNRSDDIIMHR